MSLFKYIIDTSAGLIFGLMVSISIQLYFEKNKMDSFANLMKEYYEYKDKNDNQNDKNDDKNEKNETELDCSSMSNVEQWELLNAELIKYKNKIHMSELIWSYHGCDSWEDLFRDNIPKLKDICSGIEVAIKSLKEKMEQEKEKEKEKEKDKEEEYDEEEEEEEYEYDEEEEKIIKQQKQKQWDNMNEDAEKAWANLEGWSNQEAYQG